MTDFQKTRLRSLALVWFVLVLGAFTAVILVAWGMGTRTYHPPKNMIELSNVDADQNAVAPKIDTIPSATESEDAASAHAIVNDLPVDVSVAPSPEPTDKSTQKFTYAHQHVTHDDAPVPDGTARVIPASIPTNQTPTTRGGPIKIAIIIDDMGLAVKNSYRAADLPAPVTLSYMSYAPHVQQQVDDARAKGHEIMMHMPMEPLARNLNAGPGALTTRLTPEELRAQLVANLGAFTGYVGINNHMGSRLTSTPDAMAVVMDTLQSRGIYFVDSWTSPGSVAYRAAAGDNIPRGRRDVFLDHYDGQKTVWDSLALAESMARRHGSAVVIGHPKNDTLAVLAQWLPRAKDRGIEIVPMSALIYAGDVANDPVLLADAARGQRHNAQAAAKITPAAGK